MENSIIAAILLVNTVLIVTIFVSFFKKTKQAKKDLEELRKLFAEALQTAEELGRIKGQQELIKQVSSSRIEVRNDE